MGWCVWLSLRQGLLQCSPHISWDSCSLLIQWCYFHPCNVFRCHIHSHHFQCLFSKVHQCLTMSSPISFQFRRHLLAPLMPSLFSLLSALDKLNGSIGTHKTADQAWADALLREPLMTRTVETEHPYGEGQRCEPFECTSFFFWLLFFSFPGYIWLCMPSILCENSPFQG